MILHSSLCKLFPSKAAQYTLNSPILDRLQPTRFTNSSDYQNCGPRIRTNYRLAKNTEVRPVAKELRPVAKRYLSSTCIKMFKNELFSRLTFCNFILLYIMSIGAKKVYVNFRATAPLILTTLGKIPLSIVKFFVGSHRCR
jgi:hypothetical protein